MCINTRLTLALGFAFVTLIYQNLIIDVAIAAVPALLLACLVCGIAGVHVDLEEWLWPAELLLLGIAFVVYSWHATVVLAIILVPVILVLSLAPYPPLPRR